MINCRGTLTIIGGSVELPEVRAAKMAANQQYAQLDEAHGRRRQAPGRVDWSRVGNGQRRMRGGDVSRDGRLRGRRQPRSARADPQSRRVSQRRGHHPDALTQRLRRRDPGRWREGHRSGHARGADARHRSEDGDDLPLRRPAYRLRPDVDGGHLRDRETAQRARDGRRGCRNPHDSQCSPAARRDARRIQRRQVHPRPAERRPAPRAEGSREGGMDPQRAPPRLRARHEGRPRRDDRDAGRGRELGEARSQGRVGRVGRALRLHRREGVQGRRRHRAGAARARCQSEQPQPARDAAVGLQATWHHRRRCRRICSRTESRALRSAAEAAAGWSGRCRETAASR